MASSAERSKGKGKDEATESYVGERNSEGQYHGFGKLELPAGETYEGHFKNGAMHGKGKLTTTASGSVFEGDFHEGQMQGRGVHTCEYNTARHPTPSFSH